MNVECYCLADETLLAEIVHGDLQEDVVKKYVVQLGSILPSKEMMVSISKSDKF